MPCQCHLAARCTCHLTQQHMPLNPAPSCQCKCKWHVQLDQIQCTWAAVKGRWFGWVSHGLPPPPAAAATGRRNGRTPAAFEPPLPRGLATQTPRPDRVWPNANARRPRSAGGGHPSAQTRAAWPSSGTDMDRVAAARRGLIRTTSASIHYLRANPPYLQL
jgi:hypothetical protein